MEDIPKLSNEKLEELLDSGELEQRGYQLAFREYKRRKLKPHWTLIPAFWILFFTMIFAAIAAWPVIREWLQPSPSANKAANSQPPQSQQAPVSLPASKTSPLVIDDSSKHSKT